MFPGSHAVQTSIAYGGQLSSRHRCHESNLDKIRVVIDYQEIRFTVVLQEISCDFLPW